jgi:hypothetical protein
MSFQARQGDVFFETVSADKVKRLRKKTDPIIAYGEVTGHCHRVIEPSMENLESYVDEQGDIFIMNPVGPIMIGHDEHGTIELPQGEWVMITRQREYDPADATRQRRVAD